MNLKIAVLSGDGIGPEVILQAKKALYAIGVVFDHEFVFEDALIGAIAIEKTGNPLPEQTLNLCLNTDAILFGAVTNCKHDTNSDLRPIQGLLKLRQALGLYANIRPIKPYNDLLDLSPLKRKIIEGADFIIFRELSGGSYYGEKKINGLGQTLFVATSPEQMVLIKRGNKYLVISPENARIFCERFDQINQLGSLKQFEPESENLTMLWQRVWADRWAKLMLIAGIISLALLLIAAMTIGLSREQIVWVSMERVPASRALLLALIGTLFGLINTFVGLLLYLQDSVAANVRNLIWGWTILVNAIFTVALILMAV